MYSIDEAVAEHEEHVRNEGEDEHNEHNNHVIRRLPSFRPQLNKNISRAPSFFAKMFSSRKLNQILPEDDEEEELADDDGGGEKKKGDSSLHKLEEGDEGEAKKDDAEEKADVDEDKIKSPRDKKDVLDDAHADDHDHKHKPEKKKGNDLEDELGEYPTMPDIGKPTNMDRLITRNKTAELGMNALMEMVNRDVEISLFDARHIPVSKEKDRINVTPEVSNYMAKIRSQKQIEKAVKNNMINIQKSLNYRKSSVIIMNANYSSQLVRKIEPIYTQEARTIVVFK